MKAARRLLPFALTTLVAVGAFAGSASGRAESVQFVSGNDRVVQGNQANVIVAVEPYGKAASALVSVIPTYMQ